MKKIFFLSLLPILCFSQKVREFYPNGLIKQDLTVGVKNIIYIQLKDHPKLDRSKFKDLFRPQVIEFTDGTKIQYGWMTNGEQVHEQVYNKGSDDWNVEYLLYYNPWEHTLIMAQIRYPNQPAKPYRINYATGRFIPHPTIPNKYLNEIDLTPR